MVPTQQQLTHTKYILSRRLCYSKSANYEILEFDQSLVESSKTGVMARVRSPRDSPSLDETSQELRMLSSVALNCQVTMTGVNSGSQLSEMSTISHKFTCHVMCLSWYFILSLSFFGQVMSPHHSHKMSQRSQVSRIAL